MGSMSIWHWLIVLVVVLLIFGTKKLRNIGQDLGGAVKGFKEGVKSGEDAAARRRKPTRRRRRSAVRPSKARSRRSGRSRVERRVPGADRRLVRTPDAIAQCSTSA